MQDFSCIVALCRVLPIAAGDHGSGAEGWGSGLVSFLSGPAEAGILRPSCDPHSPQPVAVVEAGALPKGPDIAVQRCKTQRSARGTGQTPDSTFLPFGLA
jgi:hypothetical protein